MTDFTKIDELTDEQLTKTRIDIDVTVGGADRGTMTLELWPEVAPATVRNFVRYVAEGFYDNKGFHRVLSGFMIQGGCPLGTGTGSGPHGNIPGEFTAQPEYSHKRGVLSMARSQDPNSASCQFFVCHGDADFLDNQYAAFGRVVEGEAALDAVAAVATGGGEGSSPLEPCGIKAMRVYSAE